MVPGHFVLLDSVPLTANGKINRKSLPEPEANSGVEYVGPRDEVEAELCALYAEVLGVARVGIEDDFFALGGHSLKVVRLLSLIRGTCAVEFKIAELFKSKTVRGLSELVRREKSIERLTTASKQMQEDIKWTTLI